MNKVKVEVVFYINVNKESGMLSDVIKGVDVFIGVFVVDVLF